VTRPYVPAGLDRGDGHHKAPHELVEYSTTIFDTSIDDADRDYRPLAEAEGDRTAPDQRRAFMLAFDVARIMRSKGDHFARTRKHIASLNLTLPRLARLNRFARNNAVRDSKWYNSDAECAAQGVTYGEWQAASRLIHRAALSMLLDVPAQNRSDAYALAGFVCDALDAPPPPQRRQAAKRLARYFAEMLDGQNVLDAPTQWVWKFNHDGMAPTFPEGSSAVIERHKGELVPGAYYVFRFRARYSTDPSGSRPAEVVRRYLHTTPAGHWAVETFKDAEGKPHRSYKDPKYWQPYYRIVRHCW
jgi:hypothetical protein